MCLISSSLVTDSVSHIPLSDRGGGDQSFSVSSNPATVSRPDGLQEKRFCRGDVNRSTGRLFWCYERDKRKDGSVHTRERWVTPEQFKHELQRKRQNDRKYVPSEATKQKRRAWARSERGKTLIARRTNKPETRAKDREKNRIWRIKYNQRPEVIAAKEERRRLREKARQLRATPEHQRLLRERGNEYIKRRYATDPKFALAYKLRARVHQAIKASGASKSGRTEELVGCSIEFLRQHIERQFKGKMSWDNPGSYHIDHIVPVSSFDLTDNQQQRIAFSWLNLRPLTPKKNMSKGAKLTEPQLPLPLTVHSTTTYSL